MFHHLSKLSKKPDFVLYMGDLPPHDVYNQSISYNNDITHYINVKLRQALPNTMILPVLGDHECFPIDQYDPNVSRNLTEFVRTRDGDDDGIDCKRMEDVPSIECSRFCV